MKNKVKSQHYVPQFYIRNFSPTRNRMVDAYLINESKFFNTNVKAICQDNFFYDIEYDEHFIYTLNLYNKASTTKINVQAELNNNSQYIETVFLKNMETDVSILIKEIIESENGIMLQRDSVRVKLLVFLENLYLRTKAFRENIQNVDEQRKLQRDAFFDVKYSQVISMVNPISDMDFHIFRGTKCEWVLAKVTDGDNLFISDNPANWYNLREFISPLSFDKAIIIRPKATNQCFLYLELSN